MPFLWVAALAAIVITLLLMEQVAVLYLLATLGVSGLLIVVALSDLGDARKLTEPAPFDDSAAIGIGIMGQAPIKQRTTPRRANRQARS